jgi:hypothetical protein
MHTIDGFWRVLVQGKCTGTIHCSERSAVKQALEVAREKPDIYVYVLQATRCFKVPRNVMEIDLDYGE